MWGQREKRLGTERGTEREEVQRRKRKRKKRDCQRDLEIACCVWGQREKRIGTEKGTGGERTHKGEREEEREKSLSEGLTCAEREDRERGRTKEREDDTDEVGQIMDRKREEAQRRERESERNEIVRGTNIARFVWEDREKRIKGKRGR